MVWYGCQMEYIDREVEVPVTKVVHKVIDIPVPQKMVSKPVLKTVQKFVEVPQVGDRARGGKDIELAFR